MRPYATCVCGLKLSVWGLKPLVYGALSYFCMRPKLLVYGMRPQATSVWGLKLLLLWWQHSTTEAAQAGCLSEEHRSAYVACWPRKRWLPKASALHSLRVKRLAFIATLVLCHYCPFELTQYAVQAKRALATSVWFFKKNLCPPHFLKKKIQKNLHNCCLH